MNIRLILSASVIACLLSAATVQAQRVQIVVGSPGCGPIGYARPEYPRPVFFGGLGYCGPTSYVVVRPVNTVYLSSTPVLASQLRVLPPISRSTVYRAPIVPVNAVRCGNGFTWRR